MRDPHQIIRRPLITEKTTTMTEKDNKVVFEVDGSANKIEVKRAVERMFEVKVLGVRTQWVHGKLKRLGRHQGRRPDWKKAIVTLQQGDKIELFQGT